MQLMRISGGRAVPPDGPPAERQCWAAPVFGRRQHSGTFAETNAFRASRATDLSRPYDGFCWIARSSISAGTASKEMPLAVAARALRQYQRMLSTPDGHRIRVIPEAVAARSVDSFSTAAAVSMIERRVTSNCASQIGARFNAWATIGCGDRCNLIVGRIGPCSATGFA